MAHLEWTNDAGHVIAVRFDAVRTVEHRQSATATRHPVEKGADISDHVRVDLPAVSITGYISSSPLFAYAEIGGIKDRPKPSGSYQKVELPKPPVVPGVGVSLLQGGVGGLVEAGLSALRGLTSPNVVESLITANAEGRPAAFLEVITEAQEKRRLVRLVDEAKTYDDMVIVGKILTRTQRDFGASVQIELEQIKIVTASLVDLPVPLEPRGLVSKLAAGAAKAAGAGGNVDEKQKSAALKIATGLYSGISNPLSLLGVPSL